MTKVVVLVDGDNISASHAALIRTKAARLGDITTCRVYTDAQGNSGWHEAHGFRVMHAGTGKNAADLLLSIDALELALRDGKRQFVIVTSDGDFSHLAQRLLDHDCHVLGLGESKAPRCFRAACSGFEVIGLSSAKVSVPPPVAASHGVSVVDKCSDLDLKIRDMIRKHTDGPHGVEIANLNVLLRREHDIRISTLPEGTWRNYLAKRPALYDLDPRGPEAKVRYLPKGFSNVA